jgi:predicted kinase
MVGLPRSGKSTWAKEQSKKHGWPMVNPDSIRLAIHGQAFRREAESLVWAHAKIMVMSLFIAGHDTVIIDATGITKGSRHQWISEAWDTMYKVIDTPMHECIDRAIKGNRSDLAVVIADMADRYEPLEDEEKEYNS